ncbi:hypothetical protein [Brevundimonas mediterranea]|jgi:hypothetical protein|uniref:Type IV secretory pathway TrbL component n=1 Tax=Brevundimonas mediterranea TaxID=74329 RepID=A0A7W6F0Q2_9CAUL|nr:hypothetical protein [Brevundimonas mediterranea]MBB3873028.1 type IV secretory pathway TrbL component [Brevundimonas mediterranea]
MTTNTPSTAMIQKLNPLSAASALILLLAACDQAPASARNSAQQSVDPAGAAPAAGTSADGAAADDDGHGQAGMDCRSAAANCSEAGRAQDHRSGMAMEREAQAQGMAAGAQAPIARPGLQTEEHMGMPMNDGKMPAPR